MQLPRISWASQSQGSSMTRLLSSLTSTSLTSDPPPPQKKNYKSATKKSSSPYPNHLPQPKQTEERCQSCKIIDESVHQVQPCASLALSQVKLSRMPTLRQKDHLQLNPKGTAGTPRNMNISPHSFVSLTMVALVVGTEFVARLFHRSRIQ
jgi:hypothetical protein